MGPWNYVSHLMSTPRLPFTAAYFGSIALTLYFSLGVSVSPISKHSFAFVNLMLFVACKYCPYFDIISRATSMLDLVPRQLLPYGLIRVSIVL
jgi:hypothetical protein